MTSDGPCPRCSGTGKRWKLLDGSDVCDECWLDVAMDRQAQHWRSAQASLAPATSTAKPVRQSTPARIRWEKEYTRMHKHVGRPPKVPDSRWRAKLREMMKPGTNSLCLLCGHLFYDATLIRCRRCGGTTKLYSDHDLHIMGRRAIQNVEAEQ